MKFSPLTPIEMRYSTSQGQSYHPGHIGGTGLTSREFRHLTPKHSLRDAHKSLELANAHFARENLPLRAHKTKGLNTGKHHFLITASDGSLWFFKINEETGVCLQEAQP